MRVGVSSYAFPRTIQADGMDVDDLVIWARQQGVDAVQFCENLPWPQDRLAPNGLVIETGCRGIGAHLEDHLRIAEQNGSGFVRLVIDDGRDQPSAEEAVERLRPWATRYRDANVVLAVENHDRLPASTLRAIVEDLGLGVVLDTANSLGCLEGTHEVVPILAPYVVNLHAKEVRAVRKPDMLGFDIVGAPFGSGGTDWASMLPRLPRLISVTLEQWAPAEYEFQWATSGLRRLRELVADR